MQLPVAFVALAATLIILVPPEDAPASARDYELRREWFPQWGKAWARNECPAVRRHLAEGLKHKDPLAHELSGIMIVTQTCSDEGLDRAASHFLMAADHGRELSMLLLAKLHALGMGVPVNEGEARRWAQRAFLGWVDDAPTDRRERLASTMNNDVPAIIQREFDRIEPLMDGLAEAKFEMASRVEQGNVGYGADEESTVVSECRELLDKAKTDPLAAHELATMHLGNGEIRRSPRNALLLFKVASNQGHEASILAVGRLLRDEGMLVQALTWFIQAEKAGIPTVDEITALRHVLAPKEVRQAEEIANTSPLLALPPHLTIYKPSQPFCASSD